MAARLRLEPPVLFFRQQLQDAIRENNLGLSQDIEAYLTFLLLALVRPEGKGGRELPNDALGVMFHDALALEPARAADVFHKVGDACLCRSGFSWKADRRKARYLELLGRSAYRELAWQNGFFEELSDSFPAAALALSELAIRWANPGTPQALLIGGTCPGSPVN